MQAEEDQRLAPGEGMSLGSSIAGYEVVESGSLCWPPFNTGNRIDLYLRAPLCSPKLPPRSLSPRSLTARSKAAILSS